MAAQPVWECEADHGWVPYDDAISHHLEIAFQANQGCTTFKVNKLIKNNVFYIHYTLYVRDSLKMTCDVMLFIYLSLPLTARSMDV
jgi:hypothetical protein